MSTGALTIVLAVGLSGLALVINHLQARLALVEVTLNEGLPPGHEVSSTEPPMAFDPDGARALLGRGVHIFLSRGCHACQRLLDELDDRGLDLGGPVHLRYVDRPRPLAETVARHVGAELHARQPDIVRRLGIDPLPHTVVVGADGLLTHATTPNVPAVVEAARGAGIV